MGKIYFFQLFIIILAGLLIVDPAFAQRTITGTVSDNGGPLPGASVILKGTSKGVSTNAMGRYVLPGIKEGQTLVFRSVGYRTKEIRVGQESVINALLESDDNTLSEVVVSALGVVRERRSLGYAVTSLKAADLNIAGPTVNPFLSVYGKAAGVGVQIGAGGPTAGINLRIRGAASLNPNISARPLFVVDGVPIRDQPSDMNNRNWDPLNSVDYGSGLNDLNPEDIESMEILKGAKATVLYGRDAGFGVVLITTKKGQQGAGFGIQASFNSSIDKPVSFIDFQNEFGSGTHSEDIQYTPEKPGKPAVRKMLNSRFSFGPRFDGSEIMMYDSTMTRYEAHPNNFVDFFRTGLQNTANIAIAGSGTNGNMRLSYTNKLYHDILPGFKQTNNTFSFTGAVNASKLARFEVSANYYNVSTTNRRPNIGGMVAWGLNRDYDYGFVKGFYKDDTGFIREMEGYSVPPSYGQFRSLVVEQYDNKDVDTRNRWLASIRSILTFNDYLSFVGNVGVDYTYTNYTKEERVRRINPTMGGKFGVQRAFKGSTNFQGMLNFDKAFVNNDLRVFAFAGGSYRYQSDDDVTIGTWGNLAFPDWYSFANQFQWPTALERGKIRNYIRGDDRLYSAFGSGTVSWKEKYHLEVQARNDWDSTLPPGKNSYFYPGASFTWNYNKFLGLKDFTLGSLRVAWADVGFGTQRYEAFEAYGVAPVDNSDVIRINVPSNIFASKFVPARKREYELGLNHRFFANNRLEYDFTYYNNNTRNEIVSIDISGASGSSYFKVNSGRVDRWGLELMVKGAPVYNAEKNLRWDVTLTGSLQRSKVVDLAPGLKQLRLEGLSGNAAVVAEVGRPFGGLKMFDYKRDDSGNQIVKSDGLYQADYDSFSEVANVMPDVFGGIISDITYKNFVLHAAADYKFGGRLFSISNYYLMGNGVTRNTLPYRDEATGGIAYYLDADSRLVRWEHNATAPPQSKDGKVYHNGMILPGVKEAQGSYVPNDILVSSSSYYQTYINDIGGYYFPDQLFKNNYIKLREISLTYNVPMKFAKRYGFQKLSLMASARNLFYFYKTLPNVDAESALGAQSYTENSFYPTTRSFNFGLTASF